MNRRDRRELDTDQWPAFDAAVLPEAQRKIFHARRKAVELYAANATLASIEETTGVVRCELYRLLVRCLTAHEDGRLYGWRGLVRYAHVADYQSVHKLAIQPNGAGAAGAFSALLQRFPAIAEWAADADEVLVFIDRHRLHGKGLGYVDVHLLAAVALSHGAKLWTRDKRLRAAAQALGCAHKEPGSH